MSKKLVSKSNEIVIWTVALAIGLGLASSGAMAADEMGDGICKLVNLLTGKWLFGFTILATLGAGAALLFGAEMTDGVKKLATIISVVGLILAMSSILSMVFSKFSGVGC